METTKNPTEMKNLETKRIGNLIDINNELRNQNAELLEVLKEIIELGYLSEYAIQDGIHAKAIKAIKNAES